ncbi:MAG TPA: hypothetical protein VF614_06820 [Chthoniobacteraceae bacterium]|jgi:hypothetical protein
MKLLILDFAKRWWWILLIAVIIAAGSTLAANPMLLGPIGAFLVFFDSSRGALRVTRPLPVSSRDQALACWVCGVPLVPMLCLPLMIMGALLAPVIGAPTDASWFAVGVQAYVATGSAALCFLIAVALPMRPPQTALEHAIATLAGAMWGLSIPGISFLLPHLPHTAAQIVAWHWVIFALAPIFMIASYTSAGELLRRRSARTDQTQRPSSSVPSTSRLMGVPLFFTTIPLRTAAMVLVMAVVQWGIMMLIMDRPFRLSPLLLVQPALFGIISSIMGAAQMGLRSFRILPISTARLAALLLASPLVAALLSGLLALAGMRLSAPEEPMMSPWAFSSLVAATGTLLLALSLRLRGGGKIVLVIAVGALFPVTSLMLPRVPAPFVIIAAVVIGLWGAILLLRGLRRSSTPYDPARHPFMFGQQPQ